MGTLSIAYKTVWAAVRQRGGHSQHVAAIPLASGHTVLLANMLLLSLIRI